MKHFGLSVLFVCLITNFVTFSWTPASAAILGEGNAKEVKDEESDSHHHQHIQQDGEVDEIMEQLFQKEDETEDTEESSGNYDEIPQLDILESSDNDTTTGELSHSISDIEEIHTVKFTKALEDEEVAKEDNNTESKPQDPEMIPTPMPLFENHLGHHKTSHDDHHLHDEHESKETVVKSAQAETTEEQHPVVVSTVDAKESGIIEIHVSSGQQLEDNHNGTEDAEPLETDISEPLLVEQYHQKGGLVGVDDHPEANLTHTNEVPDGEEEDQFGESGTVPGVESEGLFPVLAQEPLQENDKVQPYSGDGEYGSTLEEDGTDLPVAFPLSDLSSGDNEHVEIELHGSGDQFTSSPLTKQQHLGTIPTQLPSKNEMHRTWDHPAKHPLQNTAVLNRLRCEDISCEKRHSLRVTSSALGGSVIPSDTVLSIRCSAYSMINDTAVITWHLPLRVAVSRNGTLSRNVESSIAKRVNVTEEITELRGKRQRLTVSTLHVVNITAQDTGDYICVTMLTEQCCHSNVTVGIKVYEPPSYAVDFTIVGAVCFVEFLIILYFKTRHGKQKAKTDARTNGYSGDYKPVPTGPSKEQQCEDVEQQRLTT